jgi:hypothetical protein
MIKKPARCIFTKQRLTQRAPNPGKVRRDWRGGSLRVFEEFSWLKADSVITMLSHPTEQRVTQTANLL